jgi:4-hydroxythreonine-4-phosphate dehydrogenase
MTAPVPEHADTTGRASNPADAPIAISMGDPCGIGPEITLKACAKLDGQLPLIVVGDPDHLRAEAKRLRLPVPDRIEPAGHVPANLPRGRDHASGGEVAFQAVVRGARLALQGSARALVTAPLSKAALQAAGHDYPGHTELLAQLSGLGAQAVRMMLVNTELRVVLVSIHLPLRRALDQVTPGNVLDTIEITHRSLSRAGIQPLRIAVAGLNPHAGESGLFGREDLDLIAPAIEQARTRGIDAYGPFAPDTVFMRARGFRDFDVVVAMYHDQGLIPVKYLGLDEGVNVTLGLPFVRTSPDHGTAYDLAGRTDARGEGLANPASLLAAIATADHLSRLNPSSLSLSA